MTKTMLLRKNSKCIKKLTFSNDCKFSRSSKNKVQLKIESDVWQLIADELYKTNPYVSLIRVTYGWKKTFSARKRL